jgi:hypothetical protein
MNNSNATEVLYPNAVRIDEDANGNITAYDATGQIISIDSSAISVKAAEMLTEQKLLEVRQERNRLLAETDYWVFSDTATATQAQLDYRQALRDITNTYTSLDDVVWPEKP